MKLETEKSIKHFILIDPGLMELGGHHVCFSNRICEGLLANHIGTCEVFAHKALHPEIKGRLINAGASVHCHFESNFYQCFESSEPLSKEQHYIAQLSEELVSIIIRVDINSSAVAFYPCVTWQHMIAISSAIQLVKKQKNNAANIQHVICAMFNPGVSFDGKILNRKQRNNYSLALSWLTKHTNVKIVVSDKELQQAYSNLVPSSFSLHPCYLENWQAIQADGLPPSNKGKGMADRKSTERVLVYVGQAKENKGFNELPIFLENNIKQDCVYGLNKEYIVQFTYYGWEDDSVINAANNLKQLSKKYENIIVYSEYLNENQLNEQFRLANSILFLYNAAEYQFKSSGVLWLASYFDLHLYINQPSWLSREALRLGMTYTLLNNGLLPKNSSSLSADVQPLQEQEYKDTLFARFWPWLKNFLR